MWDYDIEITAVINLNMLDQGIEDLVITALLYRFIETRTAQTSLYIQHKRTEINGESLGPGRSSY